MQNAVKPGTCKLGLDTGGTFTDAVLLDASGTVISHAKSPTTHHDLSVGLRGAVAGLGQQLQQQRVNLVSMSTTLATNALVEGHGRQVCLILVGYSEKQLERARLSEVMGRDPVIFIAGGHNASGEALVEPDFGTLEQALAENAQQVDAFAVSAMFGVRNPSHEIAVRDWLRQRTEKPVTCGYELSSGLDAPRRALTAVLNARLIPLIHSLLESTSTMLGEFGIDAPLMVVKGDGSLVSEAVAAISPVETILSGPAASVVGANFLSNQQDLVVSDMGGTTTDIAVLENGAPALDPDGATVGGWTTMVRAIRIHTYGLGGDSEIGFDRESRSFTIGPLRVLPVSRCLQQLPELISELEKQLELPFGNTHNARFAFAPSLLSAKQDYADQANATEDAVTGSDTPMPSGLTGQQRELWQRISRRPIALQTLFEDQTLELPLRRLIATGHVAVAGFTPTDALLILQGQLAGMPPANVEAAALAAKLLMRYSKQNLGPDWSTVEEFATAMREQVARDAAIAVLETVLVNAPVVRGKAGGSHLAQSRQGRRRSKLPEQQRHLIQTIFDGGTSDLTLKAQLRQPLIGLGAPAVGYYQRVAELLGTSAEVPELAGVANAVGAVAGSVSQSKSMTITPVGGARVKLHTDEGPVEIDDLETAVTTAESILQPVVAELARLAGASDIQSQTERDDIVASNQGEEVFFESTITVTAFGRPATA